jgi:hypothetical protein
MPVLSSDFCSRIVTPKLGKQLRDCSPGSRLRLDSPVNVSLRIVVVRYFRKAFQQNVLLLWS